MNFIIQFFKNLFKKEIEEDSQEETEEIIKTDPGELILPERYKFLEKEVEEGRPLEDSLKVRDIFLKSEKDKQQHIARTTRDPIVQKAALESKDLDVVCSLASNNFLDEELQYKMAIEGDLKVKAILARKANLPLDIQKILAQAEEPEVRKMFARWQRPLNPHIAKILVNDSELEVRKAIAATFGEKIKVDNVLRFRAGGDEIHHFLITDPSSEVRMTLAQSNFLSRNIQISLAQKCFELREWTNLGYLAENKSLTPECESKIIELAAMMWDAFAKKSILKKLKENKELQEKKTKGS
jgi:hypothetical protein